MRRSAAHDYSRPGIYHITIHVAEGMGQPLGTVVGSAEGDAHVILTAAGAFVEHELQTAITAHYPKITVDEYIIMPDHLHFILIVHQNIVSKSGRPTHLGQVLAGFKNGCNRAYWAATGQEAPAGGGSAEGNAAGNAAGKAEAKPLRTVRTEEGDAEGDAAAKPLRTVGAEDEGAAGNAAAKPLRTVRAEGNAAGKPLRTVRTVGTVGTVGIGTVPGGYATGKLRYDSGRAPLFAKGYCDVMPLDAEQLEQQRAYIKDNPRSRWLRTSNRAWLMPRRGGIDTALTFAALRRYLQHECPPALIGAEPLAAIERRLLFADGKITCDSYGDRALLQRRLLPVVCHRKDAARLGEQQHRCMEEATRGSVLVSARIATGEKAIMDEAMNSGFPVIFIADNGFPAIYHPSAERIAQCSEGRLLMLTPWSYEYRGKNESVTVPFCKTMNCISQALCRTRDSWWKQQ